MGETNRLQQLFQQGSDQTVGFFNEQLAAANTSGKREPGKSKQVVTTGFFGQNDDIDIKESAITVTDTTTEVGDIGLTGAQAVQLSDSIAVASVERDLIAAQLQNETLQTLEAGATERFRLGTATLDKIAQSVGQGFNALSGGAGDFQVAARSSAPGEGGGRLLSSPLVLVLAAAVIGVVLFRRS